VCSLHLQRGKRHRSKSLLALSEGRLGLDFGSRFQRLHLHLDLLLFFEQLQILEAPEAGFCLHLGLHLLKAAKARYLSKCLPNFLHKSFRMELSALLLET
jgi:hypothetical protein